MIELSTHLLIGSAAALVGLREEGHNRGRMVELMLAQVGQPPGAPWCAALVYHAGYWAHFDHQEGRSSWPLPRTASCYELGEWARVRGARYLDPQPGDVFLVYAQELRRFAHTGVVAAVDGRHSNGADVVHECTTIEGNSNAGGSREGVEVVRRTRAFSRQRGDRFIRWVELGRKAKAA